MTRRLLRDDAGLSRLEWIGVVSVFFGLIVFIPPVRGLMGDVYGSLIWEDTMARGIFITILAFGVFAGAVHLLLSTNLGNRLAFLVSGAALSGFAAINGLLFVLYSPRGPRPTNVEGLNAFQIRIMPAAMMIGSTVLFAMFLVALARLEAADSDDAPG